MAITRTAITDDDGTGTTGTILDNAWKTELYDQIDAVLGAATVQTITSTGTQNNLSVTAARTLILRANNASLLTITGLAPTSTAQDGDLIYILSVGAGQVDLAHQNASSTAANRLINATTSAATSLAPASGVAQYVYDATTARWRLVVHSQGGWISSSFSAGNFTANTGSWTVDSGDVINASYFLVGRNLSVLFAIDSTTVTGTPAQLILSNAQWGGYTAAITSYGVGQIVQASTSYVAQIFVISTNFYFTRFDGTALSASTNATYCRGGLTFPVT